MVMVVQCPSRFGFTRESYDDEEERIVDEISFQCRRERDHEGNHSTNTASDGAIAESSEGPPVFRLDWRTNDGVVLRRWPKKEDKS